MALKKVEKWYAVNEFTYNTHHFFRGQEIKGLTQEEMTGLNDLIYKKEVKIDVDSVVEESAILTSNTEVKEETPVDVILEEAVEITGPKEEIETPEENTGSNKNKNKNKK